VGGRRLPGRTGGGPLGAGAGPGSKGGRSWGGPARALPLELILRISVNLRNFLLEFYRPLYLLYWLQTTGRIMYLDDEDFICPVIHKMENMLAGAKSRAKLNDRNFNLDLDHMLELYVEICPILGIDLLWKNTGRVTHGSPSLDRVNNKEGYTKGNVQIISHRANSLKKDYLLVEWEKMRNYMVHCDGKPLEITDNYFKECEDLSENIDRAIRGAARRNMSVIDIAQDLEISAGTVIKVIRRAKKKNSQSLT